MCVSTVLQQAFACKHFHCNIDSGTAHKCVFILVVDKKLLTAHNTQVVVVLQHILLYQERIRTGG